MHKTRFMITSSVVTIRSCNFLVIVSGFILSLITLSFNSFAQGNLLISPQRIVFDGNKKTKEINLANTGKDTARYLISIMEIRMTETGGFEEITVPDSGQNFASKYLRFFPRTVTLGPNEAQTVKIQLIKADQLAPGEYRSHIYFRGIPNPNPLGEEKSAETKDTGIVVKITPVFGITTPVIIRVGESDAKVAISEPNFTMFNDTIPLIGMTFNRTGNMSVYGNVNVEHIAPDGKITQVGAANGVAVYTPNQRRKFHFELQRLPGVNYKSGKLHITFVENTTDPNPKKYAETDLQLK